MAVAERGRAGTAAVVGARTRDRRSKGRRRLGPPGFIGGRVFHHGVTPLAALAMTAGLLFNGFNSVLGGAIACIVSGLLLGYMLLLQPPALALWRRGASVLVPLVAAGLWAMWGALQPGVLAAPDLFAPALLVFLAGAQALVAGWIVGLRPARLPTTIDAVVALSVAFLLFGLIGRSIDSEGVFAYWQFAYHGRFAGTIGNANATAAVAGATALLAFGRIVARLEARARGRLPTREALAVAAYMLGVVVALAAAIATASRFVFVGTLVLLVPMALAGFGGGRRRIAGLRPMLLVAGVATLLLFGRSADLLLDRFGLIAQEAGGRWQMWTHYLALVREAPLFGYGLGGFSSVNTANLTDPLTAEALWSVNSAHNILLQLALGGGVPYLLLVLIAAAALARVVVAGLGRPWDFDRIGVAAAVLLVVASATVDIALDVPAVVLLTLFLAGLLWGDALARVPRVGGAELAPA